MLNSWLILFGVEQDYAVEECDSMNGVPIGFTWLKEIYEEHLTKAISLKNTTGTFLLYQIGCTMFTDKNNKHIEVIFFEPPQDLDTVHGRSWGGTKLNYLYHLFV